MAGGVEHREVVIVGSGPGGAATAIRLAALDRGLASDVLVLDKATHPRPKTCAGGLIPKALGLLRDLDLDFRVPNVRVDRARVWTPTADLSVPGRDLGRVVRRDEFDAALAGAARERGVELREGVTVRAVARDGDRVRVETDRGTLSAGVVVGADGSGSLVRRRLVPGGGPIARAVMTDVLVEPGGWDGHDAHRYEFDFRPLRSGVRGYAWAFPCLIGGRAHVNVGAYGLPPAGGDALHEAMAAQRTRVTGADTSDVWPWKAFPIHTYRAGQRVAAERTLLVGDAAGVEALLGEGISFALEYGVLAAEAIVHARRERRWDFAQYQAAVARGRLGRKLDRLARAADHFYGPRGAWWFRLAGTSRRAQRVALGWYNGDPHLDALGRWGLAAQVLRPAAVGAP